MVCTPAHQGGQAEALAAGVTWAADNGAFGAVYPGDDEFLEWLASMPVATCLFATAPDVVCDHQRTYRRSDRVIPAIRDLGYPVAFAAQNGARPYNVPWRDLDVLFLGGDTEWKIGPAARELAGEAHRLGKRVHMGRVNTLRRLRYAEHIAVDTVDGTFLTYGPRENLPRLERYLRRVAEQAFLW